MKVCVRLARWLQGDHEPLHVIKKPVAGAGQMALRLSRPLDGNDRLRIARHTVEQIRPDWLGKAIGRRSDVHDESGLQMACRLGFVETIPRKRGDKRQEHGVGHSNDREDCCRNVVAVAGRPPRRRCTRPIPEGSCRSRPGSPARAQPPRSGTGRPYRGASLLHLLIACLSRLVGHNRDDRGSLRDS